MTKEAIFRAGMRVVFLFAYGAFLWASIRHVATFFHNFEPGGNDWTGSYTLAISIDATALVLTIGVMFFRRSMPGLALGVVWFFIVALTAFSWLVNWEYAMRYQSNDLTTDPLLKLLNPILASSFAFLNLAYSVVAEFFNTRKQAAEDLAQEADRLEALATEQNRLEAAKARMKKPSLIQRAKELALEAKTAAQEVIGAREEEGEATAAQQEPLPEPLTKTLQFLAEHPELADNRAEGSDEQLAAYLGLHREASARFWRLKALEENASSRDTELPALPVEDATPGERKNQRKNAGKTSSSTPAPPRSTTPASVTVKEAAAMLGLSETYVRELRSNKKLRSPGRNKKLILVSSVKAYQAARQKAGQSESYERQENTHPNGNGNGQVEVAYPLDKYAHVAGIQPP